MTIAKKPSAVPRNPTRTEQQEALLQEALARPGFVELMRVYGNWKKQDQAQEPYREAGQTQSRFQSSAEARI